MPKKINPLSFRLGITQVWDKTLNTYNNNTKYCMTIFNQIKFGTYLTRFLKNRKIILNSTTWVFKDTISLLISYYCISAKNPLEKNILKQNIRSWFDSPVNIFFYKHKDSINNALVLNAIIQIGLGKGASLKKVLSDLNDGIIISNYKKKIVTNTRGIVYLKLVGFQFKYAGRIDKSRNQMSKIQTMSRGNNSVSSIVKYIEYNYICMNTKCGSIGIHIWLFYKFCY